MNRIANLMQTDILDRAAMLARIERTTELPLMVLSAAMVPLLAGLLFWEPGPLPEGAVVALYLFIWAIFAVELAVRVIVAPQRARYVRRNWFDVLVVLLPVARPLRIPLIVLHGSHAYGRALRFAHVDFLAGYAISLVLLISTIVTSVERGHDSPVDSFPDALWWSIATVTTVGYGDVVPVTPAGRAFAYVLMVGGIGLFGAFTANVASMLARREDPVPAGLASLASEIRELREEIEQLREQDVPR